VLEAMLPLLREDFGNAASHAHVYGWRAEAALEMAREELAAALGVADPAGIVFTSGATESNNLALKGVVEALAGRRDHVVSVATEHSAILDPCRHLAGRGVRLTLLPVDGSGLVDPAAVAAALTDRTALVSVMAANNEIGVLQPLAEIGRLCRERGVLFHSDAAQAFGKVPLEPEALGVDLLSLSAHKLHGPKGVGALWVRRGRPRVPLVPQLHGGGHERGLRSGTVPVPLAVGFGRAARLAAEERETEAVRLRGLRDRLWARLRDALPGVHLNGHPERRLPGNLHVSFEGVAADPLLAELPGLALSTGSACTSARPEPSHVLRALGLPDERVRGGVRIGLGRFTSEAEIESAGEQLVTAVLRLRSAPPRVSRVSS
jgi:cysteine desulfurase